MLYVYMVQEDAIRNDLNQFLEQIGFETADICTVYTNARQWDSHLNMLTRGKKFFTVLNDGGRRFLAKSFAGDVNLDILDALKPLMNELTDFNGRAS